MSHILVIDTHAHRTLASVLEREGFAVSTTGAAHTALESAAGHGVDLIVLDMAVPDMPGTDLCRRLRTRSAVPIMAVSVNDSECDTVLTLELGADDYLTKPVRAHEFVARIRALLRRRPQPAAATAPDSALLEVGDVRMDLAAHTTTVAGRRIDLPLTEFALLELLLRHAGQVLTRAELLSQVWGCDRDQTTDDKTLTVHIKRLRAKIEDDRRDPQRVLTIRGLGYRYQPHPPPPGAAR